MKLPITKGTCGDGRTKEVQRLLKAQGFYQGKLDDDFGAQTAKAVEAFKKKTLTPTVTPETWEALRSTKEVSINLDAIKAVMAAKGFVFHEEEKRVNVISIRMDDVFDNRFTDKLFCVSKVNGKTKVVEIPWTTMPGTKGHGGTENPLHVNGITGAATIVEGQYLYNWVDAQDYTTLWLQYPFGYQTAPVKYYRDGNKDNRLDRGKVYEGIIGLNLHRMSNNGVEAMQVNYDAVPWSQGCQGAPQPEFKKILNQMRHHVGKWGTQFEYTLLHLNWF